MAVATGVGGRPQATQAGSDNPALNHQAFGRAITGAGGASGGMTEAGTYAKTGILLAVLLVAAAFGWTQVEIVPVGARRIAVEPAWVWLAFLLTFILGFIGAFAVRAIAIIATAWNWLGTSAMPSQPIRQTAQVTPMPIQR